VLPYSVWKRQQYTKKKEEIISPWVYVAMGAIPTALAATALYFITKSK
jgi:activator of 2-hydroxyglutaryl-CoA dehydratase